MAEPKKRHTSTRSGNRRSHLAAKTKSLQNCPKCKAISQTHQVCKNCGFYNGQDILHLEEKAKAKEDRKKSKEKEEDSNK